MAFILLGGNNVFSQPQKGFDMGKLYDIAIKKYLLPSEGHSLSIIYLEKPSFDPEYSIQLLDFKDSIQLEGHLFKESYWYQLFRHIKQYQNAEFEPEVSHYSILVSKLFYQKMQSVFSETINSKASDYINPNEMGVDGTTYLFRLGDGDNYFELWEPKANSMAFKTAAICKEIAISLKSNNFNEMEIIKAIDELR
ncbi:MAG TPA: hypothetical protein VGK10_18855 [Prolixibacteraceae bacterium]|jgi:hypothetical protein